MRSILTFLFIILLIVISFHRENATDVKDKSDTEFSALNAFAYLENIASEPHPIGSIANHKVRDYIVNELQSLGLEVTVESGSMISTWNPSNNILAYVDNIVATLPGSDPDAKKVILSGHYDSVFEGPGAADDGYAVASMIETVRLLRKQPRKNDLVLLITDGEEYGLLGADYYASLHDMDDVGILLNYEARGAEGPGIAFEWSDDNRWLVEEVSKAYERPIANSLSYEIYNRMPNSSDFTVFKEKNISGINHAFIDGFSYYHHPQDDLEHVSKNSIQHTGENMHLAAKHFTNYDFSNVTEGNASFFNFYGFLVHYSAKFDLILLILAFLLTSIAMTLVYKSETVTTRSSLITFASLLGILILCIGLCFGLSALIKMAYPQYSVFYSYQYYNHEWYLLSGIGLSTVIASIFGRKLLDRYDWDNIAVATMLTLSLLAAIVYVLAPTGMYIMMVPLYALAIGTIGKYYGDTSQRPWLTILSGLFGLVVILGLWTNFSHSLYLAFSISILAAAIIPTVLFSFASMSLTSELWQYKSGMLSIGGLLFVGSLVWAHTLSHPSEDYPLKSNLFFVYDGASDTQYAATYDDYIHEGHLGYLDNPTTGRLERPLHFSRFYQPTDVDLSTYRSRIQVDSIGIDNNRASLSMIHPTRSAMLHITINDCTHIDSLFVNGTLNKAWKDNANGIFSTRIYGMGLDTLNLRIVKNDPTQSIPLHISTEYHEMPIKDTIPKEMVREEGMVYVSEYLEI